MNHRLSYWRSLLQRQHTCRCGEHWPCVRYREQRRIASYTPEPAKLSRAIPAINPDMDQC